LLFSRRWPQADILLGGACLQRRRRPIHAGGFFIHPASASGFPNGVTPLSLSETRSCWQLTSNQAMLGEFPRQNLCTDGFEFTSPVTAFPTNGYGLHDMIGNVWEWTTDWWSASTKGDAPKACCIPGNPRGGSEAASYDSCQPNIRIPRKVLKGGSQLCAPNYCRRYRPAARHVEPVDASTNHVGSRCISRNMSRRE
jgi:hypothetical protein